jgi:hypothetical protein
MELMMGGSYNFSYTYIDHKGVERSEAMANISHEMFMYVLAILPRYYPNTIAMSLHAVEASQEQYDSPSSAAPGS